MRNLTLALALTLGLGLFANEAKAQYVSVGFGTGYNTTYVPGYAYGGYSYPGYYGMPYTTALSILPLAWMPSTRPSASAPGPARNSSKGRTPRVPWAAAWNA